MGNGESADLVLSASWVVPVEPAGRVLEDHALAVRGGAIAALGPADDIDARFSARERVHLDGHALVPGFVNAHTHAAMTLFRGLADDLPLDAWLAEHIWPAEAKFVDEGFIRAGTRLAVAEMLRGGTTCFNDMYFFPDVVGEVARDAGSGPCSASSSSTCQPRGRRNGIRTSRADSRCTRRSGAIRW